MRPALSLSFALALALGIGSGAAMLATSGCGPAYVSATVTPRLVWTAPGIWVVEGYRYAVFYVDG